MKGGLGNIMKQAQQLQERMQKTQEELAQVEVRGYAGGNLVEVTMTFSALRTASLMAAATRSSSISRSPSASREGCLSASFLC